MGHSIKGTIFELEDLLKFLNSHDIGGVFDNHYKIVILNQFRIHREQCDGEMLVFSFSRNFHNKLFFFLSIVVASFFL